MLPFATPVLNIRDRREKPRPNRPLTWSGLVTVVVVTTPNKIINI